MVICLERGADLHMAQLMPLPLNDCCLSKIQIGFTFLVSADLGSPGQRAVKRVCVRACVRVMEAFISFPVRCALHCLLLSRSVRSLTLHGRRRFRQRSFVSTTHSGWRWLSPHSRHTATTSCMAVTTSLQVTTQCNNS